MKTYKGWQDSNLNLSEYLQVGDAVDEEMYYYFLEVLPPACMSCRCVQIGEPYSHDADGPTFATLEKINGEWIYTGCKNTPKTEESLYW